MNNFYGVFYFRTVNLPVIIVFLAVLLTCTAGMSDIGTPPSDGTALLMHPDIFGNRIVFQYGDDLWVVSKSGGKAERLTSLPGFETRPRYSPDGKYIAFSGEYSGNMDVYVIPAEGGVPKRLTFHPAGDYVVDWTPDGSKILFFSSRKNHSAKYSEFYLISRNGGFPVELPVPTGYEGSFSPDGTRLAYSESFHRYYWKGYKGGSASDIRIFDLVNPGAEKISSWEGEDCYPMWIGNRIFFISDRDGRMNLYSYSMDSGKVDQITDYLDFGIRNPAAGPEAIVYERGGFLYVLNLSTMKPEKISVEVKTDKVPFLPILKNVGRYINNYHFSLSPNAKRALFEARGDIFTVPVEKGETRNITQSMNTCESRSAWSPDGKLIAFVSDATGSNEIYTIDQKGEDEPVQITKNRSECDILQLKWSPDSKKLLYSDSDRKLFYTDLTTGTPILVDSSAVYRINSFSWSSDSKWVVYSKLNDSMTSSIYVYSIDKKEVHRITDEANFDNEPVFSTDGKYIFFKSSRNFNQVGMINEDDIIYANLNKIYAVSLEKDTPSITAPESDEEESGEKEDDENKDEDGKENIKIRFDFDGISDRVVDLPIPSGNYINLQVYGDNLFYFSFPLSTFNNHEQLTLHLFDLKEKKDKIIISGFDDLSISYSGDKFIYRSGNTFGVCDASSEGKSIGDGVLNTDGVSMMVDYREEWKEIFNEAWRMERDYFYDLGMNGVDWDAVKQKYEVFLPFVSNRRILNIILSEMIGELHCSHAYCGGGDMVRIGSENTGLLGADLEPDKESGLYFFSKIYKGENWSDEMSRHAPLTQPGIDVKEGDYLLSINGHDLKYPDNPYRLLQNRSGKQTVIEVNSRPSKKKARSYTVVPTSGEQMLRYIDWVESNRRRVDEATGGRVGYIHVPNTMALGFKEFGRAFFTMMKKDGLIIDIRYNYGGFSPDPMMERLRRRITEFESFRGRRKSQVPMSSAPPVKVCIINGESGSGGDEFAYLFREYGLGKLVGTRTYGALVGIYDTWFSLVDGGYLTVPAVGFFDRDGQWIIENHGVEPDIEIENDPGVMALGTDQQLEKAIETALEQIETIKKPDPEVPPYPARG